MGAPKKMVLDQKIRNRSIALEELIEKIKRRDQSTEFRKNFVNSETKISNSVLDAKKAKKRGIEIVRKDYIPTNEINNKFLIKKFIEKNQYIDKTKPFEKGFIRDFDFIFYESVNTIEKMRLCLKHAIVHYLRSLFLAMKYGLDKSTIKLAGIHDLIEDSGYDKDLIDRIYQHFGKKIGEMAEVLTNGGSNKELSSKEKLEKYGGYLDKIVFYCNEEGLYVPLKAKGVETIDNILTVFSLDIEKQVIRFDKTIKLLYKTENIKEGEWIMLYKKIIEKSVVVLDKLIEDCKTAPERYLYGGNITKFENQQQIIANYYVTS